MDVLKKIDMMLESTVTTDVQNDVVKNNTKKEKITQQIPPKIEKDLIRLKQYYPYRHCWVALNPKSNEWELWSKPSRSQLMK